MSNVVTIGVDLGKSVSKIHCADRVGQSFALKKLRPAQIGGFLRTLSQCLSKS